MDFYPEYIKSSYTSTRKRQPNLKVTKQGDINKNSRIGNCGGLSSPETLGKNDQNQLY